MADINPSQLLKGEVPHLIDEWQLAPKLWDAVRFEVDQMDDFGQFILTGSAVPPESTQISHTGTGRITSLTMRTMELGQTFICNGWEKPAGFCDSAWETVSPFVMTLAHGGENFYDGWMKNSKSAMISCNDGFRPVSFLIETMDEDSD